MRVLSHFPAVGRRLQQLFNLLHEVRVGRHRRDRKTKPGNGFTEQQHLRELAVGVLHQLFEHDVPTVRLDRSARA